MGMKLSAVAHLIWPMSSMRYCTTTGSSLDIEIITCPPRTHNFSLFNESNHFASHFGLTRDVCL